MSKYFRGFWSFAPMSECTTHVVEANDEDEAVDKFIEWALAHQSIVDEPMDFEVEELDAKKLELAEKIVIHDARYNEYDGSIWKIYEAIKNPTALVNMVHDYVGDLSSRMDIIKDNQTYTPRQRAQAQEEIARIIYILRLSREIIIEANA